MGLLSDPEYGSVKWVRVLKKVHRPLCVLCYIGALVWFVMLANKKFNNETYFSENALLPGLVTNEFHGEEWAKQYYSEFLNELQDKYDETDRIPIPWLVGKMSQLHLEVYTHNFTLNYPMGQGQVYTGTNVYGILRAPRTSSLEALVVSAPFRPLNSHQKGTAAGIALMLAFAKFARPQKYWAKDIIFLVTEHEQLGMQAWLEAYHGLQSDSETFYSGLGSFNKGGATLDPGSSGRHRCLDPGTLKGRSGAIQAAINLEIHEPKIKYIEVKVEGLNGQLPNLDLVNLVHKLCVKSGIHHSYRNSYSWVANRNKMDEWMNNFWTMFGMVTSQIAGVPNGNHGLFHRFGIEAVTLEGRGVNDPAGAPPRAAALTPATFYRLGVALESILRSLNNLLERFHQSYFFYLLSATNRFISIGQYMPSLCLLCVAMLIRALSLWVTIQPDEENEEDTKKTNEDTDNQEKKKSDEMRKVDEESISIVTVGVNYLIVHLIGYGVMISPQLLSQIGATYFDQPSEVSVYYGFIAISAILLLTPIIPRLACKSTFEELSLVNILLLIELATFCLTVGMHNFPLGLFIATVYTPLALVVGVVDKNDRGVLLFLKRLLCVACHPLVAVYLILAAYSRGMFAEEALPSALGRAALAHMQANMFAIVDGQIYGNWLFNVVTSILLPIWIIFWQILFIRVEVNNSKSVQKKNK